MNVDAKLATILIRRKSMLEERLEQLQPRRIQRPLTTSSAGRNDP
jgi:hypothetical protein